MRVLHIIERFNPNLGQEINFIAKNKTGDTELLILTSTSLRPWNIVDYKLVKNDDLIYNNLFNVSIKRQKLLFELGEKLWLKSVIKEIKGYNPEVVYAHGIEYITFIRIILWVALKRTTKFRLVTDTHSLPMFTQGSLFRKIYYSFLRKVIIPLVNKSEIITFYTAEENKILLEKIYKVNPANVKPFLIGADLMTFKFNSAEREAKRKKYHLSPDEVLIIFTGRICNQKGPHLILEALETIKLALDQQVSLLLIGFQDESYMKSTFEPKLKSSVRVLIEMAKPSNLLPSYYSAADFAVFPLECTLSSLECQACRLPVVMEDNPTNNQRVRKGGLLYERGNINDLAEKMLLIIRDKQLREKLSEEGYTYVSENYDYLKNLRQMEMILKG